MDVRNIIALAVTLPSDREIVMTRVFDAPPEEGVAGRNFHGPVPRDRGTPTRSSRCAASCNRSGSILIHGSSPRPKPRSRTSSESHPLRREERTHARRKLAGEPLAAQTARHRIRHADLTTDDCPRPALCAEIKTGYVR
jgi:hypothetical protein